MVKSIELTLDPKLKEIRLKWIWPNLIIASGWVILICTSHWKSMNIYGKAFIIYLITFVGLLITALIFSYKKNIKSIGFCLIAI